MMTQKVHPLEHEACTLLIVNWLHLYIVFCLKAMFLLISLRTILRSVVGVYQVYIEDTRWKNIFLYFNSMCFDCID